MPSLIPFIYFSSSTVLAKLALKSSHELYRASLLVLLVSLDILAFRKIRDVTSSLFAANILGLCLLLWISHVICVLCVKKCTLPEHNTWESSSIIETYKILSNVRWINTNEGALSTRKDQNSGSDKKQQKTTRGQFLRTRALSAITIFGLNYLFQQVLSPKYYKGLSISDILPVKETYIRRFSDVTFHESAIRGALVFHFIWLAWAFFTGAHDVLALLFVGCGIDEPEDWPPLYGNPKEMYTMRRFWGKFWYVYSPSSY